MLCLDVLAPHFHGETRIPKYISSGNPLKKWGVRTPNSHLFDSLMELHLYCFKPPIFDIQSSLLLTIIFHRMHKFQHAWISNNIGINHLFPNFNGTTVDVWEWMNNFIPHFKMDVITYVSAPFGARSSALKSPDFVQDLH